MEFVGMQAIADAAGVPYHTLWVAVRTHSIVLRIDRARTNQPPIANEQEIAHIRSRLASIHVPGYTPEPQPTECEAVAVQNLIASALLLEDRAGALCERLRRGKSTGE